MFGSADRQYFLGTVAHSTKEQLPQHGHEDPIRDSSCGPSPGDASPRPTPAPCVTEPTSGPSKSGWLPQPPAKTAPSRKNGLPRTTAIPSAPCGSGAPPRPAQGGPSGAVQMQRGCKAKQRLQGPQPKKSLLSFPRRIPPSLASDLVL